MQCIRRGHSIRVQLQHYEYVYLEAFRAPANIRRLACGAHASLYTWKLSLTSFMMDIRVFGAVKRVYGQEPTRMDELRGLPDPAYGVS